MFDELISTLIKALLGVGTNVATGAINNAINPPPKPQFGNPGFNMGAPGTGNPPPGAAIGAGAAQRPAAMNFAGGFTGLPPSLPNMGGGGGGAPAGPGGFNTLDRSKPQSNQPTGGI